jgi:adenosylmethionine-8-amino-7-oxononanoate aminotransferase
MNLHIAYPELKTFLNKTLNGTITIGKLEYVEENTIKARVKKSILAANAELCLVELDRNDIVVDVQLSGLLGVARLGQNILTKERKDEETTLEKILGDAEMKGLVTIDEENRKRLTVHLDKVEALASVLELIEVKNLSFDESDIELIAELL